MHLIVGGQFFAGKDKKNMEADARRQCLQKSGFVVPPGLCHQAAHPVAVYRAFEFFLGHRETYLEFFSRLASIFSTIPHSLLCLLFALIYGLVYDPEGKNRKRFPFTEKRINMLLSFEPLIYLESMTNGVRVLDIT